jgi:hypothetical protein
MSPSETGMGSRGNFHMLISAVSEYPDWAITGRETTDISSEMTLDGQGQLS